MTKAPSYNKCRNLEILQDNIKALAGGSLENFAPPCTVSTKNNLQTALKKMKNGFTVITGKMGQRTGYRGQVTEDRLQVTNHRGP